MDSTIFGKTELDGPQTVEELLYRLAGGCYEADTPERAIELAQQAYIRYQQITS